MERVGHMHGMKTESKSLEGRTMKSTREKRTCTSVTCGIKYEVNHIGAKGPTHNSIKKTMYMMGISYHKSTAKRNEKEISHATCLLTQHTQSNRAEQMLKKKIGKHVSKSLRCEK